MSGRARAGQGRTRAVPPVQFRVTAEEYAALAQAAADHGVSVNAEARRLLLANLRVTPPSSVLHREGSQGEGTRPGDAPAPAGQCLHAPPEPGQEVTS